MKNVLVFGASGFVGLNLLKTKLTGVNFIPVGRSVKEGWVRANLSEANFTKGLPKNIDEVVYLAQSKEYRNFPGGAADMMAVNANALLQIANWAVDNGVSKIIYASTANVYSSVNSCVSVDSETNPNSFYGVSKLTGEKILEQFSHLISVDVLRFFSVYGPGQKGMLIPNMIEMVRNSKKITLTNKEGLFLSPIYIDDAISVLHKLVIEETEIKSFQVFNVSGEETVSLLEVVNLIGENLDSKPNIDFVPGVENYLCNNDKSNLRRVLGVDYKFQPLKKGLSKTISNPN